jgi:hypothetical protein
MVDEVKAAWKVSVRKALYAKASSFVRASSRVMNQWTSKHSIRNFPLKDSMNALSVGFPGRNPTA